MTAVEKRFVTRSVFFHIILQGGVMEIDFLYLSDLYDFVQILVLGSALSIVVMYIVELLKSIILTKHTSLFSLLCCIISFGFGLAWSLTFSEKLDFGLSMWLGLCLWLGANGFYQQLEESDSWLGKTVKSYSQYLSEVHLVNDYARLKELEEENKALKSKISALQQSLDSAQNEDEPDGEVLPDEPPQATPEKIMLSANFAKTEFMCQCGGKYCDGYPADISDNLLQALELVRAKFGKPITITSGLRCEQHNRAVNGVGTSKHMVGRAADFTFRNMNKQQVLNYLSGLRQYEFAYTNEENMKHAVHIQVKEDGA